MDSEKNFVELHVTGGFTTKVDPDIARKIGNRKLTLNDRRHLYVIIYHNKKKILLNRFIMNPERNFVVDHKNGDTLDNRRDNLRICTYAHNNLNLHVPIKSNSGLRGIYKRKRKMKFRAQISLNNKAFYVGSFYNKYVASFFRDKAVIRKHHARIGLNYSNEIPACDLRDFLESTKGRIFKVVFVKRSDGSCRSLTGRIGVSKYINGKGMAFDPSDKNILVVFEMRSKSYKCIPLDNVLCLFYAKKNYLITRERLSIAA
jgi:hypothetical protein